MDDYIPQKAQRRPMYFPINGTTTMLSNSSSCFNDSCHSASASDPDSDSEDSDDDAEASDSDCCDGGGRSSSDDVELSVIV